MMKKIGSIVLLACMLMILAGCGGEKESDPTREGVIKISITPQPSPTPAPGELNPEAVVSEGNLTMVNEYLANQKSSVIEETDGVQGSSSEGAEGDGSSEES